MPKVTDKAQFLSKLLSEYTDLEDVDGEIRCKFCKVKVSAFKRSVIVQHLATKKHHRYKGHHQRNDLRHDVADDPAENEDGGQVNQQQLVARTAKRFNKELCNALLGSDIPLNKLSSGPLSPFLEEWTGQKIPDRSTLRKYYVEDLYKDKIDFLRKKVKEKNCGFP